MAYYCGKTLKMLMLVKVCTWVHLLQRIIVCQDMVHMTYGGALGICVGEDWGRRRAVCRSWVQVGLQDTLCMGRSSLYWLYCCYLLNAILRTSQWRLGKAGCSEESDLLGQLELFMLASAYKSYDFRTYSGGSWVSCESKGFKFVGIRFMFWKVIQRQSLSLLCS